jgi:hypothetical protein
MRHESPMPVVTVFCPSGGLDARARSAKRNTRSRPISGLGYESVRELAKEGNLEYLSDRVQERHEEESEEA